MREVSAAPAVQSRSRSRALAWLLTNPSSPYTLAVGAVTGLSIVEGVVIGAAAGGLTGALTDEETIDLGDPVWKKDKPGWSGQQSGHADDSGGRLVKDIQEALTEIAYDPGPADGIMGRKTAAAIRQYQEDHGLLIDGKATPELAAHIQEQNTASAQQAGAGVF